MLNRLSLSKWLVLVVVLFSVAALACAPDKEIITREVIKEVPVEKIVTQEVIKEVQVPGETVLVEKVVEVQVPGETVVVEKVVEVQVPGETVVVTKEVVKTVEKEVVKIVEVPAPGKKKHLRVRYKEAINNLNPFLGAGRPAEWAFAVLGSRLIFPDDLNMQWAPDLAERWEQAADGTSYTFYLRKGARFHDGVEVTADDVVFTFTAFVNPEISQQASSVGNLLKGGKDFMEGKADKVAGIVKVDDYTVRFDFAFPNSLFLHKCCAGAIGSALVILPEHILGDVPPAQFATHPFFTESFVGSGPFKLDSPFEYEVGWSVTRNDDYFFGPPLLDKITFEAIDSRDTTFVAMQRGEIHASTYPTLTSEMYNAFIVNPQFNVIAVEGGIMRGLIFNDHFAPAQDPRVRQALIHAIDRQALIDAFWVSNGRIINTPFQNPDWGVPVAEYDARYEYNPDKARQLLQDAGWDSNQEVRHISYYVDREDYWAAIQAMLGEVGMKFDTQIMVGSAFTETWTSDPVDDWDIAFIGNGRLTDDPDGWLTNRFSSQGRNYGYHANPVTDALIAKGRLATSAQEVAEAYGAIAADWIERMPWMPLLMQNEWWYKSNKFYHPVLDQADPATSFTSVHSVPVFIDRRQIAKYHPEQWDLRE